MLGRWLCGGLCVRGGGWVVVGGCVCVGGGLCWRNIHTRVL